MQDLKEKKQSILAAFESCFSIEAVYNKIIEIGRARSKRDFCYKTKDNLVLGCQSLLYLHTELKEGRLFFQAYSEALISKGLAELLIWYFSGETPEIVLKEKPDFLEELKIQDSLTPSRVNGLYNIHLKMKQAALSALTKHSV